MQNMLTTLVGTWFICYTNFPMWLKGDKSNPTFNYTEVILKGEKVLLDEVKYYKNNKQRTITGYDYQHKQDILKFTWRGKGILSLLKSQWKVALLAPDRQWAVISFSKTLFTPEGVDIISRTPELSEKDMAEIRKQMEKDSELRKFLPSLTPIKQ
ncbi:hypothetical protein [Emticicia sp. 17c]|uniref:hypothetical protein n=1 Tax=Emticicia sp. 17c TaxID=3127704 RepID=UPI00301BCAE1